VRNDKIHSQTRGGGQCAKERIGSMRTGGGPKGTDRYNDKRPGLPVGGVLGRNGPFGMDTEEKKMVEEANVPISTEYLENVRLRGIRMVRNRLNNGHGPVGGQKEYSKAGWEEGGKDISCGGR